ncbi:hypothetical protein GCM10018793_05720 [Streptomyces sulfonofaciens]|uniref:Uncharacterized protein n=1 Tax=Streptomyces sulfonofaciens TaxID=68272 RepID=A0A919FQW5_9ACTN|nr:hypothetical protein GCM10018793_05720 [Streptomyces sulfonofaciens]
MGRAPLEGDPFRPVMWQLLVPCRFVGKGLEDLMEPTVVRCAEGHVFSTASFPMQQAERLGPGRLLRCPRCQRLRNAVPVRAAGVGRTVCEAGAVGGAEVAGGAAALRVVGPVPVE